MKREPLLPAGFGFWGTLLAGSAVALGAFGTHALADQLTPARLATFETAVRYQFLHALALLILHLHTLRPDGGIPAGALRRIGGLFLIGIGLFSGSLYALVATGVGAWGAVAPIGGFALIAAWSLWAWALRPRQTRA
jgi:uncharacterized membrane protein YgdD (TMEM256/DUF423 family)